MSYLAKLTIAAVKRHTQQSPQDVRRTKLVVKLEEQLALAQALSKGERYLITKPAWTRDPDGNRVRVQRERQVRPWWWAEGEGVCMVMRYGARQLELVKGKRGIMIATPTMLPAAINTRCTNS